MNHNPQPFLVPRGQPGSTPLIVLPSQIYLSLVEAARAQMPASTAGALVGRIETRDGDEPGTTVVIEEAAPIELRSAGMHLTIDAKGWDAVKVRLAAEDTKRIVAWFYADPGLAIFQPRVDLLEMQRALAPDTDLLLLFNPAIDQGAFYNWRDGGFVPVGGFDEALPDHASEPCVLWNAEVRGAATWLNIPVTLDGTPPATSLHRIEAASPEKPTEPLNIPQAPDAEEAAPPVHVSTDGADETPEDTVPERTVESFEPTVAEVTPAASVEPDALLPITGPLTLAGVENDVPVEDPPGNAVDAPKHETPSKLDDVPSASIVPTLSSAVRGLTETIVGNTPNEAVTYRNDGALDAREVNAAEVASSDAHHAPDGQSLAIHSERPMHNEQVATWPLVAEASTQEPSRAVGTGFAQEQRVAHLDDIPASTEADSPPDVVREPHTPPTSDSSAVPFPLVPAWAELAGVGLLNSGADAGSVSHPDENKMHEEPGTAGSTGSNAPEAGDAAPTIAPIESKMPVSREIKMAVIRRSGTLKKVVAPVVAGLALVFFLFWLYFSARPTASGHKQAEASSPSPTTSIVRMAQALPLSTNTPPRQTATTAVSHVLPQPQPSPPPPATSTSSMSRTPEMATFTPTAASTSTSTPSLTATLNLTPAPRIIAKPPPVTRRQTPVVAPTVIPKGTYTSTATSISLASTTATSIVSVSATAIGNNTTPTNTSVNIDTATPAPPPPTVLETSTPLFSFSPAPTDTDAPATPTPAFGFPPAPTDTDVPAASTPLFNFSPAPTDTVAPLTTSIIEQSGDVETAVRANSGSLLVKYPCAGYHVYPCLEKL